ncbi:MAG: Hsp70 family protein [Phycisphaerales bacterium]
MTDPKTETPTQTDPIIGIDLGTTNSLVAYADAKGPRILTGPDGERMLPSVVRYAHDASVEAVGTERASGRWSSPVGQSTR